MANMIQTMVTSLGVPLFASHGRDHTLTLCRWRHGDAEVATSEHDMVAVIVNISNTQRVERLRHGSWGHKAFPVGSFSVVDPEAGAAFKIRGMADILQLHLPMSVVQDAIGVQRRPSVRARFQESDPAVEQCAMRALVAIQSQEVSNGLLLSEIAHRLAGCLVRQRAVSDYRPKGGLAGASVKRIKELIHQRLVIGSAASITLSELAAEADLSVFHFAREFRKTVGTAPYAYVVSQRLEFARSLLANSTVTIADAATQAGFRSRAHFGALFNRRMGVSPAAFRRAVHAM